VRSFPIQAPQKGISLVREGGKEVGWIDDMADAPAGIRQLGRGDEAGQTGPHDDGVSAFHHAPRTSTPTFSRQEVSERIQAKRL
jgi:hypothetical protein